MTLRAEIMALPDRDRLPAALNLLDDLYGQNDRRIAWVKERFKLSRSLAVVMLVLSASAPRIVPRDAIYTALYGMDGERDPKIVDVLICKLRKKLAPEGITIATAWGDGWRMFAPIAMPDAADLPQGSSPALKWLRWNGQDDADLRRMVASGSDLSAIADEMDRSERSIRDRIRHLRLSFARASA